MEQLVPKHNILDLRNALKTLPKTSDQIYEKAMERVQSQDNETVSLANRTLQCVIGAVRFLHIRELQHALAVREGDYDIDDEALTAPNHLLSICSGLLTIDEKDGVIRLVHYTAQEFFKKHQHRYFSDTQEELTSICITYLSLGVFDIYTQDDDDWRWTGKYALLEYAAMNLGVHAYGGIKGAMLQAAVKLFLNETKVTVAANIALEKHPDSYVRDHPPEGITGIHYASYLGLADVVDQLLDQGWEQIDLKDTWRRPPLSWAAEWGHAAVVKLLLDTDKVALDSRDNEGRTPLLLAAMSGHDAVVKLLVDTGRVDIDPIDDEVRTPSLYAAAGGHEATVKLLLDRKRVNIDFKDRWRRTPLSWAAQGGHEAVVKLLLETGRVDIGSKDFRGWTPLRWAEEYGQKGVVALLYHDDKMDVDTEYLDG